MAKIFNSRNEWDPLKRVIIGRPEGTNVPFPVPATGGSVANFQNTAGWMIGQIV